MRFLFRYMMTPHASTGVSPAKILMGRRLRSHLSMVHPGLEEIGKDTQKKVKEKVKAMQKKWHDKKNHVRSLLVTTFWF